MAERQLAFLPTLMYMTTTKKRARSEVVKAAIAEAAEAEPGLRREDVQRIVHNAVATIPLRSAPADYTRFFVDNAISRYEMEGLVATISHYNRIESVDGQWYVFIIDEEDKVIGHYNAHLVGEDLKVPIGTDANGCKFGPDMLSATWRESGCPMYTASPRSGGRAPTTWEH